MKRNNEQSNLTELQQQFPLCGNQTATTVAPSCGNQTATTVAPLCGNQTATTGAPLCGNQTATTVAIMWKSSIETFRSDEGSIN